MRITGTHVNYYHICLRKLWLFSHGLEMEHTSEKVAEGKLLHQTAYPQRANRFREVALNSIKIDFYDPHDKVVHEIKKSNKIETAHRAQLLYYLYVLEQHGVEGVSGVLEYPLLRKTEEVNLSEADRASIASWLLEIADVVERQPCPGTINKPRCTHCSYYDFCYAAESAAEAK